MAEEELTSKMSLGESPGHCAEGEWLPALVPLAQHSFNNTMMVEAARSVVQRVPGGNFVCVGDVIDTLQVRAEEKLACVSVIFLFWL